MPSRPRFDSNPVHVTKINTEIEADVTLWKVPEKWQRVRGGKERASQLYHIV